MDHSGCLAAIRGAYDIDVIVTPPPGEPDWRWGDRFPPRGYLCPHGRAFYVVPSYEQVRQWDAEDTAG